MRKVHIVLASLAVSALAFSACVSNAAPADEGAQGASPAVAAAPLAGMDDSVFDASFFKIPANPWIADSFEKVDGDKVLMSSSTYPWANMTDAGWGGWSSRNFSLSSSEENASDGSKSLLININGKVKSKVGNGACIGLGWQNSGPFDAKYGSLLPKIAYVLVDYTWEADAANELADPFIGFSFHASGDNKDTVDGGYFITRQSKGTAAIKLNTFFDAKSTLAPQFTLKIFYAFKSNKQDGEASVNGAEIGKKMVGKLWIDSLRFADAEGNILSDL